MLAGRAEAQTADFEARAAAMRSLAVESGWAREDVVDGIRTDERWCPPPGPCAPGTSTPGADVLVITHYGLSRAIEHRRTAPSGWRVTASLGWWEESPPTFALRFERGADVLVIGWELHSPALSDGTTLAPLADDVGGDFHAWLRRELLVYLESPASLRDRVLERSRALRAHVRAHVGSLSVCDDPHAPDRFVCTPLPEGHAMMDTCMRRTLTEEERAAYLAETDALLDPRDAIVRAHATELHEALRAVFGS